MNTARRGIDQSSEKLSPRRLDNRGPGTDRRRSFRRSNPCRRFRMLIVGYCYGIRFERKLCEEVELHLAYRWFCCLALDDKVPITRRSLVFRTAPDSCRKRAAPALTFSANIGSEVAVPAQAGKCCASNSCIAAIPASGSVRANSPRNVVPLWIFDATY
jgi:hypothetical protein